MFYSQGKKIKFNCINYCLCHHVSTCTCTAVTAVTMAKIQFLTILVVVTCFLGGVVSATDKKFEVRTEHYLTLKFQSSIFNYIQ